MTGSEEFIENEIQRIPSTSKSENETYFEEVFRAKNETIKKPTTPTIEEENISDGSSTISSEYIRKCSNDSVNLPQKHTQRHSHGGFSIKNEVNRKPNRNSSYIRNYENKTDRAKLNIGSKNGNMVLQLVLPSGSQNNLENSNNYLNNNSFEEILDNNNKYKRRTNSFSSQQDLYSSITNGCYINQGYSNDFADYNNSESIPPQTPGTVAGSDENSQKSTSPEEKNRVLREHLTIILSTLYALFIVTLGLVVYISDIVIGNSPIAESFSLYLVVVAFLYIIYLTIDVTIHMKKKSRYNNLKQININERIEMKETVNDNFQLNITLPKNTKMLEPLKHNYCLNKDRHSANFFLKIGAAGFCLGHLIHSGLLLGYQIVFLTSDGSAFYECATIATLILDFLYPLYSFILLYFIFKYSNIIINKNLILSRFGLMHCISSSLCFWVWTILRETIEALSNKQYADDYNNELSHDKKISEIAFFSDNNNQPIALPLTSYNEKGAKLIKTYFNSSVRQLSSICAGDERLSVIYRNFSPYLYPFSVEYSILVVGVLFVIWQSIGKCKEKEEMSSCRQCDSPEGNGDNLESNVVIHADCHSANNGLFGGIVIMVITVVSIILFFIAINDVQLIDLGIFVNRVTSVVILLLMSITVILAYRQITKLDVNTGHISLLDDLLLYVCIPAYFLNTIFSIIPAILFHNALNITLVIVEVTQVLMQTPLIIDGLRRSSNSRDLRRTKPGRELLTFLLICNVALWITQTFEVKSQGLEDERYEFYGKELWTIIGHMCIPLMMFYRFHSAVCIADIWNHAYEPGTIS